MRIACLKLVVPEDAVITDRTAGWLHGASMILAPNDHLVVPEVSMFRPPGYRLRNELAASGERTFAAGEVVDLDGLRVTSQLRTTCDLGMMRGRDQAFAAMGAMAGLAAERVRSRRAGRAGETLPGVSACQAVQGARATGRSATAVAL